MTGDPAAFFFRSRWEVGCGREQVWDALVDFHTWTRWWPGLEKVIETIDGDAEGIGQRATSVWRGPVGYSLAITIEAVERTFPVSLKGIASGDVVGEGTWSLTELEDGAWTGIEFDWRVRANRRWMIALAPVARPVFIGSHDHIMERGAQGLASYLEAEMRQFTADAG